MIINSTFDTFCWNSSMNHRIFLDYFYHNLLFPCKDYSIKSRNAISEQFFAYFKFFVDFEKQFRVTLHQQCTTKCLYLFQI